MTKFPYLLQFLLIISLYDNKIECQTCSKEPQSCSSQNGVKYTKDANRKDAAIFNKFLNEIKGAEAKYTACELGNGCKCYENVISQDLEVFKSGITEQDIKNIQAKGTKYQIIDNKLYRDKNCMFPARCSGVEHFIKKLLPKLPNMEFILNTRDWPQIHKDYGAFGPVFSFSKTPEYHDIMYPAWAFWEGGPAISLYPTGIGRWDQHRLKLGQIGNESDWGRKIAKGFFRGSRTSAERDPLVLLSREEPHLVDAQYTKNQAWKSDADTLQAPPAKEVSFEDHCDYKFLFNFRGVAASFRFKHLFLCKSLVFHVGDDWLEFFYPSLKPWVHYVPIRANANKKEIRDVLEFFIQNDELGKKIAQNGYDFIFHNLKLRDVSCYWRKLLLKYAGLLRYKPSLDKNLVPIF